MAESAERVFISYSRRDYYFAESLSLRLTQCGVRAWMDVLQLQPGSDWERSLLEAIDGSAVLVLVASPAALASPHVRAEWQRALAQGKRVMLLGWQRRVRLPPQLQGCEWLDFRGRFAPALERLVGLLRKPGQRAPPAGARPGQLPSLPPAVLAVLLALLVPIAGYAFAVAPDVAHQGFDDFVEGLGATGGLALFTLLCAALVWALSLSLLQRRMGMTRLTLCLGFVAMPFVLSAWKVARHGPAGLEGMPVLVAQSVLEHLSWVWLLAALPLLAMSWIVLVRPLGLLHWMPTGKAWEYMRRQPTELQPIAASPAQALAAVRRFRLLHDAPDRPLAGALREALRRCGAVEGAGPGTTTVLLLSNRSSKEWLTRQQGLAADAALLSVVGSAIGLAPQLDWLWRRQWIDLRRGVMSQAQAQPALPALPEAVTQVRLPAPVARLHALLCAYAALMGVLGQLQAPPSPAAQDEAGLSAVLGAGLLAAMAWCARRLLRRELPPRALRRWLTMGLPLGCAGMLAMALTVEFPLEARAAALIGTAIAAALAGFAWHTLPRVQFWLPQAVPKLAPTQRLAPPGDWRTLLTLLLFMAVWMVPVQAFVPQLLGR